jgi:tRNA A37 methylthiotransferase MiaB
MTDQVAAPLKARRCQELADLETELRYRYFAGLLGRELEVLVEASDAASGTVQGTACRYAPVEFPAPARLIGQFARVTARSASSRAISADEPARGAC